MNTIKLECSDCGFHLGKLRIPNAVSAIEIKALCEVCKRRYKPEENSSENNKEDSQ